MDDLDAATLADVAGVLLGALPAEQCRADDRRGLSTPDRVREGRDLLRPPRGRAARRPPSRAATAQRCPAGRDRRRVPADAVYLTWRLPAGHPRVRRARPAFTCSGTARPSGCTALWSGPGDRRERQRHDDGPDRWQLVRLLVRPRPRRRSPSGRRLELIGEVEQRRRRGPTEVELRRAKAQFERSGCTTSPGSTPAPTRSASTLRCYGDPGLVNSRLEEIDDSTPTTSAAAAAWFGPDHRPPWSTAGATVSAMGAT